MGCQPSQVDQVESDPEQFAKHIRTTEAQSPQQQLHSFKLPEGFSIELFASEPDIGKPMNISFDARGRLWVTQSQEYPLFDSLRVGQDKITILEDTDADGKADNFITFADSLDIPIGIVPVPDGAIAYSIPYVYHLVDKNADDVVDHREVLLSGFQYKDTHGMINNFFRGLDGWIHADHGFANVSKVVGTDNRAPVVMNSGNTFRFRPDGTGVEFTTTGRVNPFGYAMDEFGYMYSVDCHSSPVYQLIRGADYPHFGKQPTGIGFGPAMMPHNYGSTALAGLEYYTGDQFPNDYQQNFYLGDVVKSRVYRASFDMQGSTPVLNWEPDFIVSSDPWFRPVDVKLGPDGALYIADFYNRIIGHYEVPLDHPGRDRERGRIWRITFDANRRNHRPQNWQQAQVKELIAGLNDPGLNVRMMVADQIVDRLGAQAATPVLAMMDDPQTSPEAYIHGLWILYRLQQIDQKIVDNALSHSSEKVRVHMLRIMFEQEDLDARQLDRVMELLAHESPHIQRQAVMILAKYPSNDRLIALLEAKHEVPEEDTHLAYSLKQAVRDNLRNQQVLAWTLERDWDERNIKELAQAMMGVEDPLSGKFLVENLEIFQSDHSLMVKYVNHATRQVPAAEISSLESKLRRLAGNDIGLQFSFIQSFQRGLSQRGAPADQSKDWAVTLASDIVNSPDRSNGWKVIPIRDYYQSNPWRYQQLAARENFPQQTVLISGPTEARGIALSQLRSPEFKLPAQLEFTIYGSMEKTLEEHQSLTPTNWIEIYLAGSESPVTRHQIKSVEERANISWDLSAHAGKMGYLVLNDGSNDWNEYIGVTSEDPAFPRLPELSLSDIAAQHIFACDVAATYKLKSLIPGLRQMLNDPQYDALSRVKAGEALMILSADNFQEVAAVVRDTAELTVVKDRLLTMLVDQGTTNAYQLAEQQLTALSFNTQKQVVMSMANQTNGIPRVLTAAQSMTISPKMLLEPSIKTALQDNMDEQQSLLYQKITADLTPFSEETQKLIDDRISGYTTASKSLNAGAEAFSKYCASCHQVGGSGGNIGPQLDGIGNRGVIALTEKILDPNRSISKSFVNYAVSLKDGSERQGLYRRDEGNLKVFADLSGQEFSIPSDEIQSQTALPYTLMPDNFSNTISESEYYHLVYYLLQQK